MTDENSVPELVEPAQALARSQRRCIATREILPKEAMIRFVVDAEGVVTPDLKARLPGRGLWVKAERAALKNAIERNMFAKAAKSMTIVPGDLFDRVMALAEREVFELMGLAKRSGQLVAGFEKVQGALRQGNVRLLIEAKEAAADGSMKLARLAGPGVDICAPLEAARLAAALGRDRAVHAAVMNSGLAERLAQAITRLDGLAAPDQNQTTH
jgi:predicted RNA-binding protein YlxR (DUF448 family)